MSKKIALFIDGTWNDDEGPEATNVLTLCRRLQLSQDAGPQQLVWHYIAGVGTAKPTRSSDASWRLWFNPREFAVRVKRITQNAAGGAGGYGTASRIKEAYKFLAESYSPGDQIFLFGFSRGAFAVRSLACFVDEVGLLLKDNIAEVEDAYRKYEQGGGALRSKLRRLGLPIRPSIEARTVLPFHMIGVWDTVRRLGLPAVMQWLPRSYTGYHVTDFPQYVTHIRHALALHEVRPMFEPLLWDEPSGPHKSLQQVWFAGAHADVGGGYKDRALADFALEWMVAEARGLGLQIAPSPLLPHEVSAPDTGQVHHELRGKFFFTRAKVRQDLREVQVRGVEYLGSWSVHVSATDRLMNLPLQRYVLGRVDVADAFHEVDRLTGMLAMKMACAWGVLPTCTRTLEEIKADSDGSRPTPTGISAALWNDCSVGDIQQALTRLAKWGQGELDILDEDKRALLLEAVFCKGATLLHLVGFARSYRYDSLNCEVLEISTGLDINDVQLFIEFLTLPAAKHLVRNYGHVLAVAEKALLNCQLNEKLPVKRGQPSHLTVKSSPVKSFKV